MIENLQSICINSAYACAAGVGVAVVAYGVARVMKFLSGGVKCLAVASLAGSLIFGGMTVTSVYIAGAKTNDTQQAGGDLSSTNDVGQVEGGTNGVEQVGGDDAGTNAPPNLLGRPWFGLHLGSPSPTASFVSDEDISNRWRVVSVSSNFVDASIFAFEQSNIQTFPHSNIVWENAQRRGVVFGAWNIPFEGWNFPFDDHGWSNAFMRCEGVLRDSFRDTSDQIRFLAPFALCPAANWARYNLAASRAWCATNELGGLIVAVENGAIGNDSSKIASARLDLDPSLGEIRLRYDLSLIGETVFEVGPTVNGTNTFVTVGSNTSEVVFRRVHPEDWDYDGLPNDLDPNPRVPDAGAGWNQSDAWAMLAYPSNATEIASVGYAAWVAVRAAESNRRLVGLTVASANGNLPVRLMVGDVPVLCDGREALKFVLDYGKRYSISCANGRIDTIALHGTNDVGAVESSFQAPGSAFPYEGSVGNLTVHLDAPGRGGICFSAEVDIFLDGGDVVYFGQGDGAGGIFGHFTPGSTHVLTGELHQCHSNAFLGCTWSGGPGFSFSNPESLATEVTWTAVDASDWATNFLSLVTRYEGGYSLTNVVTVCVGPEHVPPTGFSLSCQDVLFLNDDRRLERIYAVNVALTGTNGVSGAVTLECNGADSRLSFDPCMDAPTNRLEFAMGVEEGEWFLDTKTVYLSCAQIGEGRVDAAIVFTNGTSCTTSATFRVIEPLRKFVTTEECKGRIVNPPRLVWGTNTILKVGMKGELDRTNVVWSVVKGPGRVFSSGGLSAEVEATATNGTVVVEARFNQDLIQPRFVLPTDRFQDHSLNRLLAIGEVKQGEDSMRSQILLVARYNNS